MNARIERLRGELARAKEKAAEWQAKVRDLDKQITELENTEILRVVRGVTASPEELRGLLDAIRASQKTPNDTNEYGGITNEK